MIINHNMNAMNSHRQMVSNTANAGKSMEKLSSGLRINRAGDDAAGLAISEKMRGQIRGLDQGSRNAQDTISLLQTAEGGLNESHSILQRVRELAVQSANDTNTDVDRAAIQDEVTQLTKEVDRIANTTEFNTKKLLNGDLEGVKAATVGKLESEATFANGTVNLGTVVGASAAAATDVIRINVTKETSATGVSITDGGISATMFSVSTVLGNISAAKVTIGSAGITISEGSGSAGDLTDVTIALTIAQVKALKSGDSITISLSKKEDAKTDSSKQVQAQIGANAGQELGIGISKMDSEALGIRKTDGTALSVSDQRKASGAIKLINNAIEKVSTERSKIGSLQNRLEHTINNLNTSSENLQSSESRVRDVDMAKEMMTFSKNNILAQAAQAMLAQANQQPQGVLQLLR